MNSTKFKVSLILVSLFGLGVFVGGYTTHLQQSRIKDMPIPSPQITTSTEIVDEPQSSISMEDEVNAYVTQHINTSFPSLNFKNEAGEVVSPTPEGQAYLIHIVDVTCGSCLDMIEASNTLSNLIPNILVADIDSLDILQDFKDSHGFTQEFLIQADDTSYAEQLDLDYYPTSFLVDASGIILEIYIGNVPVNVIQDSIISSLGLS